MPLTTLHFLSTSCILMGEIFLRLQYSYLSYLNIDNNHLIKSQAKDLLLHGHPRDREGLSLSEYMHGHGVNLRHIGLLRSLLLQEIAAACAKGTGRPDSANLMKIGDKIVSGSCSQVAPTVSNINHSSTATSLPSTSPSTDSDSVHATTVETQSVAVDSIDIDSEGGGPNQIPGVFTPALDALQSELLLEALCRTLKVHKLRILYFSSSTLLLLSSPLIFYSPAL